MLTISQSYKHVIHAKTFSFFFFLLVFSLSVKHAKASQFPLLKDKLIKTKSSLFYLEILYILLFFIIKFYFLDLITPMVTLFYKNYFKILKDTNTFSFVTFNLKYNIK
jgi:hypothetical protein